MRSKNCLTSSMLEPGSRHSARLVFTSEQVRQYCAISGDHNAIHRELAAAQLRFPGAQDVVVPGGLVQITVTGLFGSEFPGDGCMGLSFVPERFRKPVFPGDVVDVDIEVTKIRGPVIEVDVTMKDADGALISTAKSKLLAPDDAYRQWWLDQQ